MREGPNREKCSSAHQSLGWLLWQLSWQRSPIPLSLLSLYFLLFHSRINSNALKCHCRDIKSPWMNMRKTQKWKKGIKKKEIERDVSISFFHAVCLFIGPYMIILFLMHYDKIWLQKKRVKDTSWCHIGLHFLFSLFDRDNVQDHCSKNDALYQTIAVEYHRYTNTRINSTKKCKYIKRYNYFIIKKRENSANTFKNTIYSIMLTYSILYEK